MGIPDLNPPVPFRIPIASIPLALGILKGPLWCVWIFSGIAQFILNSHIVTLPFLFIRNWGDKYAHALPYSLKKPHPNSDQNTLHPFLEQNGAKAIPFGVAHTLKTNNFIRELSPVITRTYINLYCFINDV